MMKIKRLLALMKQCINMQMKNSTVSEKNLRIFVREDRLLIVGKQML